MVATMSVEEKLALMEEKMALLEKNNIRLEQKVDDANRNIVIACTVTGACVGALAAVSSLGVAIYAYSVLATATTTKTTASFFGAAAVGGAIGAGVGYGVGQGLVHSKFVGE